MILLLQIVGIILIMCGFVALNFVLALYISVKKLGGNIERKDAIVIISFALSLFICGMILYHIGG
jgi:hypothetical protein